MKYAILLQQHPDQSFEASVPLLSGLSRTGKTRSETLALIQQAITTTLRTSELIFVDVPDEPITIANPWLETAGLFADDTFLETMLHEIYVARDRED